MRCAGILRGKRDQFLDGGLGFKEPRCVPREVFLRHARRVPHFIRHFRHHIGHSKKAALDAPVFAC